MLLLEEEDDEEEDEDEHLELFAVLGVALLLFAVLGVALLLLALLGVALLLLALLPSTPSMSQEKQQLYVRRAHKNSTDTMNLKADSPKELAIKVTKRMRRRSFILCICICFYKI